MTSEQSIELREHLIQELNSNGFSTVVDQVNSRLLEDEDLESFERDPKNLLYFFLSESISILNTLSNKNYDRLLGRFNEFVVTTSGERISNISVELLGREERELFDLSRLPNYSDLINTFRETLDEILNDN